MRCPRHKLKGLEGAEIDELGVLYRSRRVAPLVKHEITLAVGKEKLPGIVWVVNLGRDYSGPVPALGGTHLYPMDELACHAFYGAPPEGWQWSYAHHHDGEIENNAKGNLAWASCAEVKSFTVHRALMRPSHLPTRVVVSPAGRFSNRVMKPLPMFAGSASVQPLPSVVRRIGAA